MSFTLDPGVLQSITQEARQCFLEEDAPGYLEVLQQGLDRLAHDRSPDYQALMRAAHSIKGGAGGAQIPELSELAHKLEDLLEAWNQNRIEDTEGALSLLQRGIEELADLLSSARDSQEILGADPNLLRDIDRFNAELPKNHSLGSASALCDVTPAKLKLIRTALSSDLENCLTQVENLLSEGVGIDREATPVEYRLLSQLQILAEESLLLGEAYDLPWLVSAAERLAQFCQQPQPKAVSEFARQWIDELRQQRDRHLHEIARSQQAISSDNAASGDANPADWNEAAELPIPYDRADAQLRIPLQQLEEIGSVVGELMTYHERLTLHQQQLRQSSQNLRRLVEQVKPVRDRVQSIYDQMSTSPAAASPQNPEAEEFDALEMDRYTTLHSSLQTFEELITQVQETRVDLDLLARELGQDLTQVRMDLDRLYDRVTTSRLVPFKIFAQRFLPQLRRMAGRSAKNVQLHVSGENVLVDKVLLEQLQTPIAQILNNALAHGIETPEERAMLDKSPVAQIFLGAKIEAGEVAISFADDGRGIDLIQVYRKAVERGLCPPHVPIDRLQRQEILNFIFQSGFSTADTVSNLSGRGVGMDIVRTQVERLRGSIDVETLTGRGTTFTIRLPLSMSLLSLLLCRVAGRTLALPVETILETIPLSDLAGEDGNGNSSATGETPWWKKTDVIQWRGQRVPLRPLISLLSYNRQFTMSVPPKVVLVLKGASGAIAVTIDSIIDERQLILRSFDDTVPVPPYVIGCTILGSGEVVPVILPRFLKILEGQKPVTVPSLFPVASNRTILVVEDSTGARRSLERILSHAGYAVLPCRDGQEALNTLGQRQGRADVVISDVEMPVMNGFDLLARIRAHSHWHALPVLMLTSRTGDRHRQKAMSLGANAYLGKPVTPTELLAGIEQLLPS
ncbi:MAG: hybrid sensor histidine kinase/response regulator [Cyanobacteria bacterium J055]|nr:MAG: hybrid sensor histidine kinase/response regulator [Cyanobacteria bacterium J055]